MHRRVYGELNKGQARAIETIHRRCEELGRRLDGFADWLYLMTGEDLGPVVAVDVQQVVLDESERLGVVPSTVFPDSLSRVRAAEGPFAIAVRELLHNAQRFGEGPVQITVKPEESSVFLEIQDDGLGPTADLLGCTTPPEGGVARARGWLARMGGTLSFSEASPHGTVARITLPRAEEPVATSAEDIQ